MNTFSNFFKAIKYIFTDKHCFALTMIPVLIGLAIYSLGITSLFSWIGSFKFSWIAKFLGADSWIISTLAWILKAIVGFLAYFIVNWTFVLFVSAIGCLFNDYISERAEKIYLGQPLPPINKAFSKWSSKFIFIIFNEVKKISFILVFTLIAYVLNFIPMLVPISLGLSFLLVSAQFVDYTWYRYELSFTQCLSDTKKNSFGYLLSGALYFALINVPVINLFVPAIATAHYSIDFAKKNSHS